MTGATLRRTLHVTSAACLLLIPATSWAFFRTAAVATAVLVVGLEIVRLRSSWVGGWLGGLVPVFRPAESRRPSGAMWLAVGYAIASMFPPPAPVAGILVGALADPAAAWIGEASGKTNAKTWRGSMGHLLVAAAVLLVAGFSWTSSIIAAALGTTLERWPGPLNDNLIVPPVVAASVSLLA